MINVAGISRPTSFAKGTEDDWRDVVDVHLGGYLNVLAAALPIMAAAGHGRILGVTSGSGWRPADTGAYGCAKRAVAALTWQLGRCAPEGVVVNAMSPIAVTRMVTAALARVPASGATGGSSATGGLSLGSMPQPEELGPLGAHLVGEDLSWCSGQVIFAGGSEVAVIEPPRLLEVVRTADAASLAGVLDAVVPGALVPAEAGQRTGGASNPRFGAIFDEAPGGASAAPAVRSCAVVTDRPELGAAVSAALSARSIACHTATVATDFAGAPASLEAAGAVDGGRGRAGRRERGGRCAVGADPGRARRHHRWHPRRRGLGPRRRRPFRRDRAPHPPRHPHRRHAPPAAEAGRRRWPSTPARPVGRRTIAWRRSR